MDATGAYGGLGLTVFVAGLVILIVAWVALPVALYGTKAILREILAEIRRTNALLEKNR